MGENFKCPRCGNTDPRKIGYLNGKPYCRACIVFKGREVIKPKKHHLANTFSLPYSLTAKQQELSDGLILNIIRDNQSLVHAVCGSGKTEIVLASIAYTLSQGKTVGFAIPRRDVVIEIWHRLKGIFKHNKVIAVYGGHNDILEGDIIVLTTHQLYRYPHYFDLLILDELDAFPFNGSQTLHNLLEESLSEGGHTIMMSATVDTMKSITVMNHPQILKLNKRFHEHPLPVPNIVIGRMFLKYFLLIQHLKKIEKAHKPCFIFTPTIQICEQTFSFIKLFFKKVNYVHSKRKYRSSIISSFKRGEFDFLVTTAVLERGVTLKDLQVIVFRSDHPIYDKASLVQISGRVGRKIDAPEGEVIFICDRKTSAMEECIRDITSANEDL